jgi:hypothetical protein
MSSTSLAVLLVRDKKVPHDVYLEIEKAFGHQGGETRVINNPEELDIFLDNMAIVAKSAKELGFLSVTIDVFVTLEVTLDLAGLVLKIEKTPVRILVQRERNNPRFELWGYY